MRPILALGLAAFALVAVVATPAVSATAVVIRVTPMQDTLVPAGNANVTLQIERTCDNQAQVLPAAPVRVTVTQDPRLLSVEGSMDGAFAQQVCAQQMTQPLFMRLVLEAPRDLNATAATDIKFTVQAGGDTVYPAPIPASAAARFTVVVAGDGAQVKGAGGDEKPAPGLDAGLLALGLVALAAVAGRKSR